MKNLLFTLLLGGIFSSGTICLGQEQKYSTLYIQGDKVNPFYVKINGKMQPRYSKNYCIIPKLAAGKLNVDILFQMNAYPAESFTVDVPENGSMAYMLSQKSETFVLYDLKTKTYLFPDKTTKK